jgi:hypothetical protein
MPKLKTQTIYDRETKEVTSRSRGRKVKNPDFSEASINFCIDMMLAAKKRGELN